MAAATVHKESEKIQSSKGFAISLYISRSDITLYVLYDRYNSYSGEEPEYPQYLNRFFYDL